MPSTGTPRSKTAFGARSVESSYADMWLPERTTPAGLYSRTNASLTSQGWISQYTFASRTRRAMSCVYWAPKSRIRTFCRVSAGFSAPTLLDPVIRRLLDDLDIMHVRFAHAGGRDLDELALRAQLVDRRAPGVAHARAQAAHELLDHPHRAAFVSDAPFHAFRHQLVDVHVGVLEVAVRRALLHRAERAHAAIRLVRAAL